MKKRQALAFVFSLLMAESFFCSTGLSQTKSPAEETFFLSGLVKDISWDHKTIVVNKKKFSLSQDTLIVDQKGNPLKSGDLRLNADVAIDAVRQPDGYVIRRIVLITNRGV